MKIVKPEWVNYDSNRALYSIDIHPDGTRMTLTAGTGVELVVCTDGNKYQYNPDGSKVRTGASTAAG